MIQRLQLTLQSEFTHTLVVPAEKSFLPLRQHIWINIKINMETIVDYQQKLKSKNIHCTIPVWIAWSEKLQQSKFKLNA